VDSKSKSATRWVVILTGIGSLMAALDTVVVGTALPTIRANLGASVDQLQWTVNGYALTFAVLLLTGAALGDRFGRRRMYATGLTLFALASAACALAPNIGVLIAARAVQGAGAALLTPLALAMLGAAFPPDKRGAAIGIFSGITGISVALGPLVGGAVTQGISWEWIFWLNVPIGLAAAPLVLLKLPESHGADRSLDFRGLALMAAASFGIVWGLVRANTVGWGSVEVIVSFAAGVALIACFIVWERRAKTPMLPPHFFRNRAFAAGNAGIFFTFASLFSLVFFGAQLMENGLGSGPLQAGLRLMPWTATFITIAPAAGALADRFGSRPFMVAGLALQAAGQLWLALVITPGVAYGALLGPFIVAGIGVSMAIPAGQSAVMSAVSESALGKAAGANSTMNQLGGVFGVALAVATFSAAGSYASVSSFFDGLAPAIGVMAALSAIGALAASALPRAAGELISVLPIPQEAG
jgi:EmrB/QacA subfamily drug resistance transporter